MTREQIHIGDMSHETAIGILKLMLEAMETYDGISPTTERINAMKMAIEALGQEPTTKNDLGVDSISRKDVFETIDDCNSDGLKGIFCSYDDGERFKEYIKNLPPVTPQAPRWIPVTERLPEEREWYLAVFQEFDTGFQLIPRVADYIGRGENKWRLIDEGGLVPEYRDLLECVAWMPLPEPYKAESEE